MVTTVSSFRLFTLGSLAAQHHVVQRIALSELSGLCIPEIVTWYLQGATEAYTNLYWYDLSVWISIATWPLPLQAVPIITTDELQAMVAQDYDATLLVVDVRSSEEYTHS